VRRNLSIGCLLFAWLCANGALWNVVQVVAWVKMYHDYSRVMPAARALQITFDGSAPCELCRITQKAHDAERDQLPKDVLPGATLGKILLVSETAAPLVLVRPAADWPGVVDAAGLIRCEAVPVPPPRA